MTEKTRRFTILEHHWNGVHWDFLVEDGSHLRTWAIDDPLVVGIERSARALPAHRRVYLDYEGEVSGGRGRVQRWDSGLCQIIEWKEDRVCLRVEGNQIAGVIDFRGRLVDGERRWVVCLGKLS